MRCLSDWSSECSFFFSSRRRHTRCLSDWSSDVCSSDLATHRNAVSKDERHVHNELMAILAADLAGEDDVVSLTDVLYRRVYMRSVLDPPPAASEVDRKS